MIYGEQQTGTKNFINKFNGSNYGYTTLDIIGAQKDTKKKGIITQRFTNPLRPKYKYPGYEELKAGGNQFSDPYGRYTNKSGANTTIGGKRLPELFVKKESNNNNNLNNEILKTEGNVISNKLSLEQPVSNYKIEPKLQNEEKLSDKISPKNSQVQSPKQNSPKQTQTNLPIQNEDQKRSSHSLSPQSHKSNNLTNINENYKANNNIHLIKNNDKLLNNNYHISSPTEPNLNVDSDKIFSNLPKYDDTVKFDKDKYKKPYPFYGFLHDKYIIPPIEEHKKTKIEGNPNLKSFQETVIAKSNLMKAGLPKRQFDKSIHKSYAEKLDDFMTKSNLKYIETEVQQIEQPPIMINNEGEGEIPNQDSNKIPEKK